MGSGRERLILYPPPGTPFSRFAAGLSSAGFALAPVIPGLEPSDDDQLLPGAIAERALILACLEIVCDPPVMVLDGGGGPTENVCSVPVKPRSAMPDDSRKDGR